MKDERLALWGLLKAVNATYKNDMVAAPIPIKASTLEHCGDIRQQWNAPYPLAEFDTFRRFELPVIAVIGTDASWAQIAREQTEILEDDVGTVLRRTDYHRVAEGYGGKGLLLDDPQKTDQVLSQAKELAAQGHAVGRGHGFRRQIERGQMHLAFANLWRRSLRKVDPPGHTTVCQTAGRREPGAGCRRRSMASNIYLQRR